MKFETWLFKRMVGVLESGEYEIKYKKNLKEVSYQKGGFKTVDCWGMVEPDESIIYIEFLDDCGNGKSPGKTLILFHELAHIVFDEYFSINEEEKEEDFVLALEHFYEKLSEKQKTLLASYLPNSPSNKRKK